ncbi:FadR/GntR family transcriptional regulator [Actinomadura scrupuli]|uniref:FadR/GntR family transcriptional regulator n=1 Tax=Actinomadura scrupuli TaxID=559629 RepID=UPI003D957C81
MTTTVDHALRALLDQGAQDGTLRPGSKLPTERDLVERLAVPRSAIRRALAALEDEGVIIRHVGRGTFLAETPALGHGAPDNTSPAEIMQVRLLLEPQVASTAARLATQADLDRITRCLEKGGASLDYQGFEHWDTALHHAIAQAAHNGLLMSVYDVMNAARALPVWGSLKRRTFTPERRACYHEDHTAIVEALHDRHSDTAREVMRDHLIRVSDNLLGRH